MLKSIKIAAHERHQGGTTKGAGVADGAVSYLTKEQVEAFLTAIPATNHRDRLLFHLIYTYGLRRREAAALRLDHLAEGRIWINRVKKGVSGGYPVTAETRDLVSAYLATRRGDRNPHLFVTRQSRRNAQPISPSTIYAAFRRYAAAAGLPLTHQHVHVLRHSIAVHWMNVGCDISDCQDLLGHRQLSSTAIYARVTNKRREETFHRVHGSGELAALLT
jgi:integrase/recombinase XerD